MNHLIERFLAKFDKTESCWIWTGYTRKYRKQHYGQFRISGGMQLAHRVSFEIFKGPIPDGMFVCHSCDNPSCVNPEHLFIGSHKDNMKDMATKGRTNWISGVTAAKSTDRYGTKNPANKLTQEQAMLAKCCPTKMGALKLMADHFKVAPATLCQIRKGKWWKNLPNPTADDFKKSDALILALEAQ